MELSGEHPFLDIDIERLRPAFSIRLIHSGPRFAFCTENVLMPVLYEVEGNRRRMVLQLRSECFTRGVQPTVAAYMKMVVWVVR